MAMTPPGLHGGDGARVASMLGVPVEQILDLSQSLNPLATDPKPLLARHLDAIDRYPDPEHATHALATTMGVDEDRLLLTNGGAEAITLVASLFGGSVQEPEFALHPRGTGPRWRSNPHNPLGLLAPPDERAAIWDEAFFPLSSGRWTRGDPDSIVVGSLTKLLACPGLRIGYVLADPTIVARCREHQPMWSLNSLACEALPDLLDTVDLESSREGIARLRTQLRDVLTRHGLHARPSDANWLLVDAPGLREQLMPQGIVIRDCANFGLAGIVRIAVPDLSGIDRLDHALATLHAKSDGTWSRDRTDQ